MQALIQRGQIWWAQVPYNDSADESKERPVVILGWSSFARGDDHNILVAPITTFDGDPSKARAGDFAPADRAGAGLKPTAFIRCRRLMTLNPRSFYFDRPLLGSLAVDDLEVVFTEVEKMFSVASFVQVPGT